MRTPLIILPMLVVASCTSAPQPAPESETTHPDAAPIAPFDECTVTTERSTVAEFSHVATCSELSLAAYPPVGGNHYPVWAAFQTYDTPVPWGFLMHSMEHGAVVLAYRCDGTCTLPDDLQALIDERPADPVCAGHAAARRMVLVPVPDLEWPIAAVAWGRRYVATCFDAPSLRSFIDDAYGHGREDLCHDGADLSASGWCPAP